MATDPDQPDSLRFARLIAHQLRSPVAGAESILRSLLGGFAGPLSTKQKDLLERAYARCEQASTSVQRMLAIATDLEQQGIREGVTDLAEVARQVYHQFTEEASEHAISLSLDVEMDPALVTGQEAALSEVLQALLNNALKYTPDIGRVRLSLRGGDRPETVAVTVADSGVGIPEESRERVFEPFFRTPAAQSSSRPGVGLGLTFVKSVVETLGGEVSIGKADLGGAEVTVQLPVATRPAPTGPKPGEAPSLRVVIIGGRVGGPKVAARITRLMPDAQVTVVERERFLSYAGCGLAYCISGAVRDYRELMSTPAGTVRNPVFFQQMKNVQVLNQTEAIRIDREAQQVRVRDCLTNEESSLAYDHLVLATGASPVTPTIPGIELENVYTLKGLSDAEAICAALADERARDVLVLGGGLIGVEVTDPLVQRGCRVTMVETAPQILGILDEDMARLVERHLESHGVRVLTGTRVDALHGDEEGRVKSVSVQGAELPADMAVVGIGVQPNVELARAAGLEIGLTGSVRVDEHMRTSDPSISAVGDCVECTDLVTGRPCYVPLGSTANKQGRVAAGNICGREEAFPGVLGTTVCKVFDYCVARTGLTETQARRAGYDTVAVLVPGWDKDHFMPGAKELLLKLVVDVKSRRILGVQATGPGDAAKRVDVAAVGITSALTVDALANADLGYAPAYAPAIDNLVAAAHVALNKLNGTMRGIRAAEVRRMQTQGEDFVFLDVRTPGEFERVRLPGSRLIPLGALRGRVDELPKDRTIVLFSSRSVRAYEASVILRAAGFPDVRVLDGGIAMWPYRKPQ